MEIKRTENIIIDKPDLTLEFELDKNMYERCFLGLWPNENKSKKKEGNNMIESLQLINLYEEKQIIKLEKEYKKKIEVIRDKLSLRDQLNDIITKAEEQITELYFSQFSEEQKEEYSKGKIVDQSGFSLISRKQIRLIPDGSIHVNEMIENEEIHNLYKELQVKREEIKEKMRVVKAHVGIAKTKEEVEEILTNYGILKKGKLVD